MNRRVRRIICHDCLAVLSSDERLHYVYQCHGCVVVEHDFAHLAVRDPEHPDLPLRRESAVELGAVKRAG